MKKLIWLMVLGVIFFIGGQWIGLNFSEANRTSPAGSVQNGSASRANSQVPSQGSDSK